MKPIRYSLFNRSSRMGALALLLSALTLTACETPETTVETPVTEPDLTEAPIEEETALEEPAEVQEEFNVQAGEITGNVDEYLGQTVSVRAEAEQAVGETAFLLQDDQLFGGEEIIVFNATGEPFVVPQDEPTENVQVTGEVRELIIADLERDYGLTLDPGLYTEYEDRPAIIAESIVLSPDPEEISEEPAAYYDQLIAVSGEIGEQLSPNTFTIQEEQLFGGEEVLVVGAALDPAIEVNEEVVVTGVLRPFVRAEFERDYDLTWDLDVQREIEAEYTDKPVLVAREIYPSAQ
ncbi:MAG: hypothetical protein Kow00121_62420 [Elainellaceae cyanobacterium]